MQGPTAAPPDRGARAITEVAYAPAEPATSRGHLLDLYLPQPDSEDPDDPVRAAAPLIVWSSGSAWLSDDGKSGAAAVAGFFTARGYAVAGVSVRSSRQARFPAQLHDMKAALRWLRAHAGTYGLDPERFTVMGNSSGGWLAAMAALTGGDQELEGTVGVQGGSSAVQAAVDFYGPTDFLQMDAHMLDHALFNQTLGVTDCHDDAQSPESRLVGRPIQTCPETVAAANPVTYACATAPPILILHGQDDPLVPHHQSELLYEALKSAGATATFFSIPGVGHEHPYVTDPSVAHDPTVSETRKGIETVRADAPTPSWETVERFIASALRRSESSGT